MKRIILLVISIILLIFFAYFGKSKAQKVSKDTMRIAVITGTEGIADQSYNQTCYETLTQWSKENNCDFTYFKATGSNDTTRISAINAAVQNGYNVLVITGFSFAYPVVKCSELHKNIKFISLDISEDDFMAAAKLLGKKDFKLPSNVYSANYKEEISGFLAGYAAVKEGSRHPGFLGGIGVPSVIRFGYGYLQGINLAAKEIGASNKVTVEYVYGGQFYADQQITAAMEGWVNTRGVDVIFPCGGGIWTSAAEAAVHSKTKIIGVDVDQSHSINSYKDGLCLTSATKGLGATVKHLMNEIKAGNWDSYSGKIENLGLISSENPEDNYVQLPLNTWSLKKFTIDDYKALLKRIIDGEIQISNKTEKMPELKIKVNKYPNIK